MDTHISSHYVFGYRRHASKQAASDCSFTIVSSMYTLDLEAKSKTVRYGLHLCFFFVFSVLLLIDHKPTRRDKWITLIINTARVCGMLHGLSFHPMPVFTQSQLQRLEKGTPVEIKVSCENLPKGRGEHALCVL